MQHSSSSSYRYIIVIMLFIVLISAGLIIIGSNLNYLKTIIDSIEKYVLTIEPYSSRDMHAVQLPSTISKNMKEMNCYTITYSNSKDEMTIVKIKVKAISRNIIPGTDMVAYELLERGSVPITDVKRLQWNAMSCS